MPLATGNINYSALPMSQREKEALAAEQFQRDQLATQGATSDANQMSRLYQQFISSGSAAGYNPIELANSARDAFGIKYGPNAGPAVQDIAAPKIDRASTFDPSGMPKSLRSRLFDLSQQTAGQKLSEQNRQSAVGRAVDQAGTYFNSLAAGDYDVTKYADIVRNITGLGYGNQAGNNANTSSARSPLSASALQAILAKAQASGNGGASATNAMAGMMPRVINPGPGGAAPTGGALPGPIVPGPGGPQPILPGGASGGIGGTPQAPSAPGDTIVLPRGRPAPAGYVPVGQSGSSIIYKRGGDRPAGFIRTEAQPVVLPPPPGSGGNGVGGATSSATNALRSSLFKALGI